MLQVLHRRHVGVDAGDLGERRGAGRRAPSAASGRWSRGFSSTNRRPVFSALPPPPSPPTDEADMRDIGRLAEDVGDLLLQLHHRVEGDVLPRLGRDLRAGRCPPAGRSPSARSEAARPCRPAWRRRRASISGWKRRQNFSAAIVAARGCASKPRLEHAVRARAPDRCSALRRSRREHSIGVSVSDTKAEATIATVTTTANSLKMRPMTPPISSTGMNTATSETEIEMMVKPISRAPFSAASKAESPSSSMCRTMFSSMTMASSTTRPTDSVRPSSEMLSMREVEQIHRRRASRSARSEPRAPG